MAVILLGFWVKVLQCIDDRNPVASPLDLQASKIQQGVGGWNYFFLRESRQDLLSEATVVAEETMSIEPKLDFRHWKRTHFFDEADVEISEECPEVIFRNKIFYVALDSIISQLKTLFSAMKQICNEFSMLWNFRDMSDETDCLET